MNPTGWGLLSIGLGLFTTGFFLWRRRGPLSGSRRLAANVAGAACVLLFLFAFMQWASWYKWFRASSQTFSDLPHGFRDLRYRIPYL